MWSWYESAVFAATCAVETATYQFCGENSSEGKSCISEWMQYYSLTRIMFSCRSFLACVPKIDEGCGQNVLIEWKNITIPGRKMGRNCQTVSLMTRTTSPFDSSGKRKPKLADLDRFWSADGCTFVALYV